MSLPPEPTILPVTLSAKSKHGPILPVPMDILKPNEAEIELKRSKTMPINYENGRKKEPKMFNFSNYYNHREKLPRHYHPLVQFLEDSEVKYHNDNLFENSSIGFPTRAQILKERRIHLPILKDSPAEKARFRRKKDEINASVQSAKRRYKFTTYDGFSDHYFLTGARFNRNDTIDSKILNKYGMFLNRSNPNSIYIKSNQRAFDSISDDLFKMSMINGNDRSDNLYKAKSCQITPKSSIKKQGINNENY